MTQIIEWWRRGSIMVWASGALLAFSLLMMGSLVGYMAIQGLGFFWPSPIAQFQTPDGPVMGRITDHEIANRHGVSKLQIQQANRDLYGQDFRWLPTASLSQPSYPRDAVFVERMEYGPFIGRILDVKRHGTSILHHGVSQDVALQLLPTAIKLRQEIRRIEKDEAGSLNQKLEALRQQAESLTVVLISADGQTKECPLSAVVRIVPSNALDFLGKCQIYASRLWEFIADDPRESNTEGGIFPALFGTVMMVLLMSIMVVPLGVIAALYMREYARQGWLIRILRVAVNNLAGVPSIVFGVFGLGFFVYTLGGGIDRFFFADKLPTPTFGTGGILWASLTLALLTVPVVIVATEEALAAVPRSQREASLALGATQWQTLWNVVLPASTPGILTGLILAMARGAGEVAPLMLTGVVKLAPSMPMDGSFPYLHLDRKFMHLGFHIYDVGFQSPNSEAAKPMVFMTALLLLLIVLILNVFALRLRSRMRARMGGSTF